MPAPLSTFLNAWYRLTHPVYSIVWRVVQPTTIGVKVIATDPSGRVLLSKARYQRYWTLLGGGVHKREMPEDAAVRELCEETGIRVGADELVLAGVLSNSAEGKSDYIVMFAVTLHDVVDPGPGVEIEAAGWYRMDALPEGTSPATRRRLAEFAGGRPMRGQW